MKRPFRLSLNGVLGHANGVYPRSLNDPPVASFTNSTTDNTVDFTDTSSDPDNNISSWSWDFGDGATSTAQNPTHTYDSKGDYSVTLTVTDDEGEQDSVTNTVSPTGASWVDSFESYNGTNGDDFKVNWNHNAIGDISTSINTSSNTPHGSHSFTVDVNIDHTSGYTSLINTKNDARTWGTFGYSYRESSNSGGHGVWLVDSSGRKVAAIGTTNPDAVYRDDAGEYTFGGTGSYQEWYRFDLTFDWSAKTYDFTWDPLSTTASTQSVSNINFINGNATDITAAHIGYFGSSMNGQTGYQDDYFVFEE